MDETLVTLLGGLFKRVEELQKNNPSLDTTDLTSSCILIQSYLDGFKTMSLHKEEPRSEPLPYMSYEDLSKLTRPSRKTPKGHIGPTRTMSHYAEEKDNMRARYIDTVLQDLKGIEKNKKPFF